MIYAYIVITFGYWGRGQTLAVAATQAAKAGARKQDDAIAKLVVGDDKPSILGSGSLERNVGAEVLMLGMFKLGQLLRCADKVSELKDR